MTVCFCCSLTANRFQKPGTKKSAKWTAEPGPSSSELHHSAAIYNHQHKQKNSHRLQHLQWQVSGEPVAAGRTSLLFNIIPVICNIIWVLQGWLPWASWNNSSNKSAVNCQCLLPSSPSTSPSWAWHCAVCAEDTVVPKLERACTHT